MKHVVCTIASENYAAQVGALAKSLNANDKNCEFWWLIVDRKKDIKLPTAWSVNHVYVEDLCIPEFNYLSFVYTIVEWNTNVKPSFLKWLFRRTGSVIVTYFDPDIAIYRNLDDLRSNHDHSDVLITPHAMSPVPNDFPGSDRLFLKNGTWNLGFISFKKSIEADRLLDWWESSCLSLGFTEPPAGLFVDQKWINLLPAISNRVGIIRDPSWNVAYWNLFERNIVRCNEKWFVNQNDALTFFHFSGFKWKFEKNITTHTNGLFAVDFGISSLFSGYAQSCSQSLSEVSGFRNEYSFGFFYNGQSIPDLARRLAIGWRDLNGQFDPYLFTGNWAKFLKCAGCINTKVPRQIPRNPREMKGSDRRLRIINFSLRLCARIVGAERYLLMMKYFSYVNVGRNQNHVFFPDKFDSCNEIKAL
jgi:hypothetical protein